MPKQVIERGMSGAGQLTPGELPAGGPCGLLHALGPDVQWLQSFTRAATGSGEPDP